MAAHELIHALKRFAAHEGFSEKDRSRATRLLSRIETSVRVTLLGPQKDHVHGLIEALLGDTLPPLPPAPITFGFGATEKILAIGPCGSAVDVAHYDGPTDALLFECPVPFLEAVQLTTFPWHITRESAPNFEEIDIAVWCSEEVTTAELGIWENAPNILKDHSFLLASTTDAPDVVEAEFLSFYQVATSLDAHKAYTSVARDLRARVEAGRAADLDNAALFLEMHREALKAVPDELPITETQAEHKSVSEGQAESLSPPDMTPAISLLRRDASYMLSSLETTPDEAHAAILSQCAETGQNLASFFEAELWTSAAPELQEEVLAGADRLVLLSLEEGAGPAIEAVTVLLQLKRDFEARLAA